MGARLRCALATMATICDRSVSLPTRSARMRNEPVWLSVPPVTLSPATFLTGMDSPVTFDNDAVHGNFFTGPNAEEIPFLHMRDGDFHIFAISDYAGCLSSLIQQRFYYRTGSAAGFGFKHLSKQNQRGDYSGGLKIKWNDRAGPETGWKCLREKEGSNTKAVGGTDAQRDKREHVEVTIAERIPTADKKRPAGPEDHRRRKNELDPLVETRRDPVIEVEAWNEVRHGQEENRGCKESGYPKAPSHVFGFGIVGLWLVRDCDGLESHSADWAVAGLILADLRMHRTGVAGLGFLLKRGILLKSPLVLGTIARFIRLNAGKSSTRGTRIRMILFLAEIALGKIWCCAFHILFALFLVWRLQIIGAIRSRQGPQRPRQRGQSCQY